MTKPSAAGQQLTLTELLRDFDFSIGSPAANQKKATDPEKPDVVIGYRVAGSQRRQTVGDFSFTSFVRREFGKAGPEEGMKWMVVGVTKKGRAKKIAIAFDSEVIKERAYISSGSGYQANSKAMAEKVITSLGIEIPHVRDACLKIAGKMEFISTGVYSVRPLWAEYSDGDIAKQYKFTDEGKLIRPRKPRKKTSQ